MTSTFRHRLAIGLLLAGLAGSGFAQYGGGGGGMMGMGGGGLGGGRGGRGGGNAQPRSDGSSNPQTLSAQAHDKLLDLRLRLMITPAQGPLFDAFSSQAWDLWVHGRMARSPEDGDPSAAEAVRSRATRIQQSAQQWQALADSVDKLYAALTPDQQQLADRELPAVLPPPARAGGDAGGNLRSP